MAIDIKQLETNLNLFAINNEFKNLELHYVIATDEKSFRFVNWYEMPAENEKKFYCYLTEKELFIPAGNIQLKESYVLSEEPAYPILKTADDFCQLLDEVEPGKPAKGIRAFTDAEIENIQEQLQEKCGQVDKHVVTSNEAQHLLFVVKDVEISISATMVYFKHKTFFATQHYEHVLEDHE